MKKKILSIGLAVALCVMAAVGGTLAYFFDTAEATNTFTVGNVAIDLIEKGEDADGDGYTDTDTNGDGVIDESEAVTDPFEQDQTLFPGSATVNNVAKRAWVTNTGKNDAWVWGEVWVPAALESQSTPKNASENSLHFNYYGQFDSVFYDSTWAAAFAQTPITDGILDANKTPTVPGMMEVAPEALWTLAVDDAGEAAIEQKEQNGVTYNVYTFKMENKLPAGKTSLPFLRQVYMDANVTQCTDAAHTDCLVLKDGTTHYSGTWELLVKAYAMQTEGFDTVDAAIEGYRAANTVAP